MIQILLEASVKWAIALSYLNGHKDLQVEYRVGYSVVLALFKEEYIFFREIFLKKITPSPR